MMLSSANVLLCSTPAQIWCRYYLHVFLQTWANMQKRSYLLTLPVQANKSNTVHDFLYGLDARVDMSRYYICVMFASPLANNRDTEIKKEKETMLFTQRLSPRIFVLLHSSLRRHCDCQLPRNVHNVYTYYSALFC